MIQLTISRGRRGGACSPLHLHPKVLFIDSSEMQRRGIAMRKREQFIYILCHKNSSVMSNEDNFSNTGGNRGD